MEISIQNGQVTFVHGTDRFMVTLHRTLRLPEDGKTHALPPSLGHFPIKRVEDYKDKVPKEWLKHGGVFFPMWQREAMWLGFSCSKNFACKVAAGKINAVSGKTWSPELAPSDTSGSGDPRQDYMVCPAQRWLDGFNTGKGVINQFVAMPLGMGYTVEGQVTGKEDFGGLQIMAVPVKAGGPADQELHRLSGSAGLNLDHLVTMDSGPILGGSPGASYGGGGIYGSSLMSPITASNGLHAPLGGGFPPAKASPLRSLRSASLPKAAEMGLAAGGSMEQKIYPDSFGIDAWDTSESGRVFIHIVNSEMYEQITGEKPPQSPITAQTYAKHGYPWYSLWDAEMGDVPPSEALSGVKTVSQKDTEHGFTGQQDDSPIQEAVKKLPILQGSLVKDGTW